MKIVVDNNGNTVKNGGDTVHRVLVLFFLREW